MVRGIVICHCQLVFLTNWATRTDKIKKKGENAPRSKALTETILIQDLKQFLSLNTTSLKFRLLRFYKMHLYHTGPNFTIIPKIKICLNLNLAKFQNTNFVKIKIFGNIWFHFDGNLWLKALIFKFCRQYSQYLLNFS